MTALASFRAATVAALVLVLQACGGGGGGGDSAPAGPTVTAITPDRLSYGQPTTFTVTGTNLGGDVTFAATGCAGLTRGTGGTATQQTFACTPGAALSVRVSAHAGGAELHAATLAVPKPQVTLVTTRGTILVELEPGIVQATVDNFLGYVRSGFYNGTLFHRVVHNFVVQGGGFTAVAGNTLTPKAGTGAPIALETNRGLSNVRGSIAMARTSAPNSATSQFFFNTVDNQHMLDWASDASPGYAVFGRVVTGLGVIDFMNGVATGSVGSFDDVPVDDIVLQSATQSR